MIIELNVHPLSGISETVFCIALEHTAVSPTKLIWKKYSFFASKFVKQEKDFISQVRSFASLYSITTSCEQVDRILKLSFTCMLW